MFLKTVLILRIFTSHYVSINSIFTLTKVRPPMAFTSHYVSINSEQSQDELFTSKIFTSHYVSINSSRRNASIFELANLHPTMYLLIPSKTAILIIIVQRFTSHYVSINSFYSITSAELSSTFTSHYVSINSIPTLPVINMSDTFTSHYVSINSIQQPQSVGQLLQDLHPTMYLLILFLFTIHCYIQLHLHPTMYLLILTLQRQGIQVSVFTSHYVSINSVCLLKLYYLLL